MGEHLLSPSLGVVESCPCGGQPRLHPLLTSTWMATTHSHHLHCHFPHQLLHLYQWHMISLRNFRDLTQLVRSIPPESPPMMMNVPTSTTTSLVRKLSGQANAKLEMNSSFIVVALHPQSYPYYRDISFLLSQC